MTKLEKLEKAKAKVVEKFDARIAAEKEYLAKVEAKKAAKPAAKEAKTKKVSRKERKNTVSSANVKSF